MLEVNWHPTNVTFISVCFHTPNLFWFCQTASHDEVASSDTVTGLHIANPNVGFNMIYNNLRIEQSETMIKKKRRQKMWWTQCHTQWWTFCHSPILRNIVVVSQPIQHKSINMDMNTKMSNSGHCLTFFSIWKESKSSLSSLSMTFYVTTKNIAE